MLLYIICCILSVILLCVMFLYYKNRKTLLEASQELAEAKNNLHNLSDTDKMYERLGEDDIKVEFGCGLLCIIDPQKNGKFLYEIVALRQNLTDKLGYILPEIRFCDNNELEENQFAVFIHGSVVLSGYIYPDRFFISAKDYCNNKKQDNQSDIITCKGPHKEECYWIKDSEMLGQNIKYLTPIEALKLYLKEITIEYVDEILTLKNTQKYINIVKKNYSSAVADNLSEFISINTLRQILVNLIREKVSVKDIGFIFERLTEYAKYSKDSNTLSERLRVALQQQIINRYNISGRLYVLTLSPDLEKLLSKSIQKTETRTMFMLSPNQIQTLIKMVEKNISEKTNKTISNRPIILCSSDIRLPLFQLLVKQISNIVVISYSELTTNIKVEVLSEINMD